MVKVVVNKCYGGFGVSKSGAEWMAARGHFYAAGELAGTGGRYYGHFGDIDRSDATLVECVETLGQEASGEYASLQITEVPDDVDWEIGEYDGQEWVQEKHRTW